MIDSSDRALNFREKDLDIPWKKITKVSIYYMHKATFSWSMAHCSDSNKNNIN